MAQGSVLLAQLELEREELLCVMSRIETMISGTMKSQCEVDTPVS